VSLWILNQSLLIINELALYDAKPIIANFSGPYSLSITVARGCISGPRIFGRRIIFVSGFRDLRWQISSTW
jgi:hypothetical protein